MEDLFALLMFLVFFIVPVLKKIRKSQTGKGSEDGAPKRPMVDFLRKAIETNKEKAWEEKTKRAKMSPEDSGGSVKGSFGEILSKIMGVDLQKSAPATMNYWDNDELGEPGESTPPFQAMPEEGPELYPKSPELESPSPPLDTGGETSTALVEIGEALHPYDKVALRKAVIWSEILAPPLALRDS